MIVRVEQSSDHEGGARGPDHLISGEMSQGMLAGAVIVVVCSDGNEPQAWTPKNVETLFSLPTTGASGRARKLA